MGQDQKLKESFRRLDKNGDGRLAFEDFYELLLKGNPSFPEEEAKELFDKADSDASGLLDFNEFVDYLYSDKTFENIILDNAAEQEAKSVIMTTPQVVRKAASDAVRARGADWRELSWRQRLAEVKEIEAKDEVPVQQGRKKTTAIGDMNQAELVNYSICRDDLSFVGNDQEATRELLAFKESLKTADTPLEYLDFTKFIAKGTAGWVFLAKRKAPGAKMVAVKLIRMTQVNTALKEWYLAKILKKAGVDNIVGTDHQVYVIPRMEAPDVIEEQLQKAGPVQYYVCMVQEFMNAGTLEGRAQAGTLTPENMFKALEDVATTLDLMHKKKVQHRDVKPENVLLEMEDDQITAAKLCDFGSAEISDSQKGFWDDTRRFGVMLFSLVSGEGWTKNRLIHEDHDALVSRLHGVVKGMGPVFEALPTILGNILGGILTLEQIAGKMAQLRKDAKSG